jgi:hypothetical protein
MQARQTRPRYARIGIKRPVKHPIHPGGNHRLGAWAGASLVTAWLEGDVQIGTTGQFTGGAQCENFGMRGAGSRVITLADNPAVTHQYCTDRWVRGGAPLTATSQLDGPRHEAFCGRCTRGHL